MENKYIEVILASEGIKTNKYAVVSKSKDNILGKIVWFGRWRQYCFFPNVETVFNNECLEYIAFKLREINTEHRNKNKNEK